MHWTDSNARDILWNHNFKNAPEKFAKIRQPWKHIQYTDQHPCNYSLQPHTKTRYIEQRLNEWISKTYTLSLKLGVFGWRVKLCKTNLHTAWKYACVSAVRKAACSDTAALQLITLSQKGIYTCIYVCSWKLRKLDFLGASNVSQMQRKTRGINKSERGGKFYSKNVLNKKM